jgi:hypothetical protein
MMAASERMLLGIDISKSKMDVMLFKGTQHLHERFNNSAAGIAELLKWLASQQVSELHVCLEATNVYWEEVAQALYGTGYRVSVVNPRRIKGFGMSQMQRSKTDKADSEVIASFCAATEPAAWQPRTPTQTARLAAAPAGFEEEPGPTQKSPTNDQGCGCQSLVATLGGGFGSRTASGGETIERCERTVSGVA